MNNQDTYKTDQDEATNPETLSNDEIRRAQDFYSELRHKVSSWLTSENIEPELQNVLLLLPDMFVLLVRLVGDERVDIFHKIEMATAITYVISPIDIIPDFLGPIGFIDDLFVVAFVLTHLLSITGKTGENIVLENWSGDDDVLYNIKETVSKANAILTRLGIVTLLIDRIKKIQE